MKLQRILLAGAAAMLATIGMVGLTAAQNSIDETLRIGVIVETNSADDQAALEAAKLAAADLNEDEGVVGPDDTRYGFEVLSYEVATAADVTEALADAVDDNVIAIIGPRDAALAEGLDDDGQPAVPVLLTASDSPTGTYRYRTAADYTVWAEAAADYLANVRHFERIALVTVDTESAVTARDAFNAALTDELVADLRVDVEASSFVSEASTIRDEDAQALFVWTLDGQMPSLISDLQSVGWDGVIVTTSLGNSDVSQSALGNTFGLAHWISSAYDADSQTFAADFSTQTGQNASDAAALAYDALQLAAAAVDQSGPDVSAIANWIANTGELDGVAGGYDGGVLTTVRLFQISSDGSTIEAAVYNEGVCSSCASIWPADVSDEDVEDSRTLRIGLIAATNTPNAELAASIEQAARLAIRDINEAGGALDANGIRYTFSLNVYEADDGETAEAAIQEAADDGVTILLGPDYNGQVLSNLDDAEGLGVLQLVSATSDQIALGEAGDYVFQVRATDSALAQAMADYLVNVRELTQIATVAVNTDYGIEAALRFTDVVDDSEDGDVVLTLEHDVEEFDMSALAQQIVDANIEAVSVWSTEPAAQALANALGGLGWSGTFAYGYLTPEFAESTSGLDLNFIGAVNWWQSAEDWTSRSFNSRYQERYNAVPAPQSAAYYDAIYLIHSAVTEAGPEVADVQEWLLSQESFIGVQGIYAPSTYNTGELTRSVMIVQAHGGEVSEIGRYENGICLITCGE